MPDAPKTIFDHIPKTGGTSIKAAIERALGEVNTPRQYAASHHIVVGGAGSRRFISRHLWFYAGEPLISGWFYATLLRDPLDRFLSQYYFHRQYRRQVLEGSMTEPAVVAAVFQNDLDGYLLDERPELTRSYSNFQAVHFAARMCENPYALSEAHLLEAAIASLKEYDLVGVHAEIGTFLDVYCSALGVPRQELPRMNVTQGRKFAHEISRKTRCKLIAANAVDLALVDWARHDYPLHRSPTTRTAVAGVTNFGTREIEIHTIECWETESAGVVLPYAERMCIRLKCRSRIREDDLTVGIAVHTAAGDEVLGVNSNVLGSHFAVPANSEFVVRIECNACFAAGDYQITFALVRGISHEDRCYHWISGAQRFRVEPGQTSGGDPGTGVTFAIEKIHSNARSDVPQCRCHRRTAMSAARNRSTWPPNQARFNID